MVTTLAAALIPLAMASVAAQTPSPDELVEALEKVVSTAIEKAQPSVVAIHRYKSSGGETTLAVRGRRKIRQLDGLVPRTNRLLPRTTDDFISFDWGAGVVVGDQGEILTTFHVVKGAAELVVRAPGRQQVQAEVIAADARIDLAVIVPVANAPDPPRLKPIVIGDATKLHKGAFLVALGNSFNAARDGQPSASWGILANLARKLEPDLDEMQIPRKPLRLFNYPTLLQLDSKLNLGMSGGAVVNMRGELVGITSSAASPEGFDAMAGYAIPMDRLGRRAVSILKQGKEIEYGFLGIQADAHYSNRVREVQPGSPAARAQLQADDQIIRVGDVEVNDFDGLILAINAYSPGESVKLRIKRRGEEIERTVVLAKYPVDGEVIATNRPPGWRGLRVDYPSPLEPRINSPLFSDAPQPSVLVVEVEEGSAAEAAGLKKGQLIRLAAGKAVGTPKAFAEAVANQTGPVTLETDTGTVTVK